MSAQSPTGIVASEIRERAVREGRVRLLVELRLPAGRHVAEGELTPAGVATQRNDIAAARRGVLARLVGRNHRVVHLYDSVPLVALEVDANALAELDASAFWVGRVVEDALHAPTLPQSIPIIGADIAWSRGYDGTGTAVAILDTGVDSAHPFLAGRVVEEACYSANLCPNHSTSQTGAGAATPCTLPGCWHGTHVAGIAAGNGATASVPFSGVAKDASIIAVQVFSRFDSASSCGGSPPCVLAYTSDIIAGLDRVYALRGSLAIAAANLSLGGAVSTTTCDSDPTKRAIDNLRSVGIATVIASGNGSRTNAISAPGCISSAVSVAATTKADAVASFSNVASFLSLLAPGESIQSSVTGGGFGAASGTSMATPHVTGAWAVLKQAAPNATVNEILSALQTTGVPITDRRAGGSVTKPRIRLGQAINVVAPAFAVTSITPAQGAQGSSLDVTVSGTGFAGGAALSVGAGIAVTNVVVQSPAQISATLTISASAAMGARDVTVTNLGGASAVLPSGFTVTAAASPASLDLVFNGKLRDRVGQGNTLLAPDGALDGTLTATLSATGGRTVTGLTLQSSSSGVWDTTGSTGYWALGAAGTLDGGLLNNPTTAAVDFAVADGGTFVVFASDYAGVQFVAGIRLTLTATFSDGTSATATTTVAGGASGLSVVFNGKLRDRVGQANSALAADGGLDGTLTATLSAPGGRTVTGVTLQSTGPGTWDTSAATGYWALGIAGSLDGALLNNPTTAEVSFTVTDGGSFVVFASDYADIEFLAGATLTLTTTFSDGTSASATTTVGSTAGLSLVYNGKLRDRVGQGNAALAEDGAVDGMFTVTLNASGGRTVTGLALERTGSGRWDTAGATDYWVLGVAGATDGPLLNNPTSAAVNFPVPDGGTFVLFASDYAGAMFLPGSTFMVTATFSDGTSATAAIGVP